MKTQPSFVSFVSKRERLLRWMNSNKSGMELKDLNDLYFSEHAAERMIERKLEKDKTFVVGISKWFMQNVFYQTTYNMRSYQISLRGLKCVFYISPGEVHGKRFAILKTVFENSTDYDCDEKIVLK